MRKLILIPASLVLFLFIDVAIAEIREPDARSPQEAVKKLGVEVLAQALARALVWRLHLPQKVDDTTYLENVRADHDKIIYDLSTSRYGNEFDQMMGGLRADAEANNCRSEDYRKLLAYGLTVAVDFTSSSGQTATPIMVTPQMCGAL